MNAGFEQGTSENLPLISSETIVHFFKDNADFISCESRGAKVESSSRESYGDNAIGFVQLKRDNQICIVKARMTPEHRVKKKPYEVTLICNEKTSQIISIQCEGCAASQAGCKHAVALLFWIHRISVSPSTTDVKCYWKKSKLSNVGTSRKYICASEIGGEAEKNNLSPPNPDILKEFLELSKKENVMNFQLSNIFSSKISLSVHHMKSSFVSGKIGDTAKEFVAYASTIMTSALCEEAASTTIKQADSPLWHELRYGRVTASKAYEASKCSTLDGSLVEYILGSKFKPTAAIERGRKLESEVIKRVKTTNVKIKKCGLLLDYRFPVLGASPDGISEVFIVEVKCPSSPEALKTYIVNNSPTAKYFAQVQMQMYFAKRSKALFCVAHPDFETSHSVTEVWVDFDEEYCKVLIDNVMKFWYNAIFPRI